jgi:quercetin dioxygenase-like cupin family protein
MRGEPSAPLLLRTLEGEAAGATRPTPYGSVGTILDSDSTEVVWVCKQDEDIDPGWFSQPDTDVLCVVAGQLKVEFRAEPGTTLTLRPGDVLVLPPDTACRAYRWPRDSKQAAVFLAVTARSGRAGRATDHGHATPPAKSRPEGPDGSAAHSTTLGE